MPSTSKKQARTMAAIAHGWKPPASSGIKIPVKVAKEFNAADAHPKLASRALRKSTGGTTFGTAIGGGAAGGGAGGGS